MIIGAESAAERVVELLGAEGYELIPSTPAKVVGDLARSKPKLLLFELDESATRVDELMQRIQATAYGALVPVVFFGPTPGPSLAEVVMLGGDLFLPTPLDPEKLITSVRRLGGEPPARKAATPAPEEAEPPAPEPPSPDTKAVDGPSQRNPTASMAKMADGLDPERPPKVPEPYDLDDLDDLDDLEDLSRLDKLAMPWDEAPFTQEAKSVEHHPADDEPDLLKQAMAMDLMLDPREMALTITTMVPEIGAPDDDLPPAAEVTDVPLPSDEMAPPADPHDEASAVDASVQEFMGAGGDGDTVAVRIRRTISAFEEQIVTPQEDAFDTGPIAVASAERPDGSGGPEARYDIDLDALDVDTAAGAYEADPERVLRKLEAGLGKPVLRPEPPPDPVLTPGGTEVSHPGRLPPEPAPQDAPIVAAPKVAEPEVAEPEGGDADASAPFTPALKNAYTEAREVPAPESDEPVPQGTIADPRAPLASPYDLPPVVSAQGFEYVDPRGKRMDVVDTVPGRRTAVHFPSDAPGDPKTHLEGRDAAENTQPAKGLGGQNDRPKPPAVDASASASEPVEPRAPSTAEAAPRVAPEVPVRLREGTLTELDPASLLQTIALHELDGALVITAPDARYELFFAGGVPRLAQSSRHEDRMLIMLRRQGRITDEQLKECESEVLGGRRSGAVLLDRGWIKSAELIPTVRLHLEDLVYAIFALEEGTFRFDPDQPLPDEIVHLEQRPAALLLEGIRRKYTPGRIIRLAGSEKIIPIRTPNADEGLLAGAELSGHDWRIIDAMDGRCAIIDIAEKLDATPHDVWALAWGLACLGLVKLQQRTQAPVVDSRPTERLPPPPLSRPVEDFDFDLDVERVVSRHALVREGDYFACLGANPESSAHELRRAYDLARTQFDPEELHPAVRTEYGPELQEILDVVEEAYRVLRDDEIRAAYRHHVVHSETAGESP